MRRHTWRYVTHEPDTYMGGCRWKWRCAKCARFVTVFKGTGHDKKSARPRSKDPGHREVAGNCDVEIVRVVLTT